MALTKINTQAIPNNTINLASQVTGSLPAANGGTALGRAPHYCSVFLDAHSGGILSANTRVVCPMASTFIDNASAYNVSTYRYVIPSSGKYAVWGQMAMIHNAGAGQSNQFYLELQVLFF